MIRSKRKRSIVVETPVLTRVISGHSSPGDSCACRTLALFIIAGIMPKVEIADQHWRLLGSDSSETSANRAVRGATGISLTRARHVAMSISAHAKHGTEPCSRTAKTGFPACGDQHERASSTRRLAARRCGEYAWRRHGRSHQEVGE